MSPEILGLHQITVSPDGSTHSEVGLMFRMNIHAPRVPFLLLFLA